MRCWQPRKAPDLFSQSRMIRSFKIPVCFERIVGKRYIISGHHTQSGTLQSERYLAISLHDPEIFVNLL